MTLLQDIHLRPLVIRTVVDHNRLLSKLVEGHGSVDSAPIKLHRASNAIYTTSKDENTVVIECNIVGGGVVGGLVLRVSNCKRATLECRSNKNKCKRSGSEDGALT
jgi:hypothetical protein